jgi:hypothetical protein
MAALDVGEEGDLAVLGDELPDAAQQLHGLHRRLLVIRAYSHGHVD